MAMVEWQQDTETLDIERYVRIYDTGGCGQVRCRVGWKDTVHRGKTTRSWWGQIYRAGGIEYRGGFESKGAAMAWVDGAVDR